MNKKEEKRLALRSTRPGNETILPVVEKDEDPDVLEIINLHKGAETLLLRGANAMILIGERLLKKKKELPHGTFQEWVFNNFVVDSNNPKYFSYRTARRYMQAYEKKEQISKSTDVRTIYQLLSSGIKDDNEQTNVSNIKDPEELLQKLDSGQNLSKGEKIFLSDILTKRREKIFADAKKKTDKIDAYLSKLR
ncbi:hypothetical protein [Leptospira interrogans]|uniref:hypothetical protein n=1 Tax=Leptospira interrogans TaxID=173 RepID=UPI0007735767|nr:hypothetical protein [Leptospira interrogans]